MPRRHHVRTGIQRCPDVFVREVRRPDHFARFTAAQIHADREDASFGTTRSGSTSRYAAARSGRPRRARRLHRRRDRSTPRRRPDPRCRAPRRRDGHTHVPRSRSRRDVEVLPAAIPAMVKAHSGALPRTLRPPVTSTVTKRVATFSIADDRLRQGRTGLAQRCSPAYALVARRLPP